MDQKIKKILIVDDDQGVRLMIQRLLLIENHYIIEEAADGNEALEKLKTFKADLVILDILMPGKDGYQTCAGIKNDIGLKNVKIVGISGESKEIGSFFIQKFGANEFLQKPFSSLDFKNTISRLLEDKKNHER